MNTPLNNLVIYNGYPLSIVAALIIHIMIFLTLLYLQSASNSQALELVQPTVIKALFIDDNPQLRNQQLREQRRVEQRRQEQQQNERQKQQQAEQTLALHQQPAEQKLALHQTAQEQAEQRRAAHRHGPR